jgi:hypothetical protein
MSRVSLGPRAGFRSEMGEDAGRRSSTHDRIIRIEDMKGLARPNRLIVG